MKIYKNAYAVYEEELYLFEDEQTKETGTYLKPSGNRVNISFLSHLEEVIPLPEQKEYFDSLFQIAQEAIALQEQIAKAKNALAEKTAAGKEVMTIIANVSPYVGKETLLEVVREVGGKMISSSFTENKTILSFLMEVPYKPIYDCGKFDFIHSAYANIYEVYKNTNLWDYFAFDTSQDFKNELLQIASDLEARVELVPYGQINHDGLPMLHLGLDVRLIIEGSLPKTKKKALEDFILLRTHTDPKYTLKFKEKV